MGGRAPGLLAKRLLNQALVASTTWNMATRTCVSVDHGDSQAAILGSERVPQLRGERGGGLLEELGCLSGGVQARSRLADMFLATRWFVRRGAKAVGGEGSRHPWLPFRVGVQFLVFVPAASRGLGRLV